MRVRSSVVVTVIAWTAMIVSAVLIPVSTISFLMILARSYGTSTFDPLGFLAVVVAPPATFLAGIGLLRRKRWARQYMIALLAALIVVNVRTSLRPARPERTYISPSGVRTTVLASGPGASAFSIGMIVASGAVLLALFSPPVRAEF